MENYQKLSHIDHILLRPDTFIGSTEPERSTQWILNPDPHSQSNSTFTQKEIEYIPGLYKIFDEILLNAYENYSRTDCPKRMDEIRVIINEKEKNISIWNNGQSIPIILHQQHQKYIPDLIFGPNFFSSPQTTPSKISGFGAKICNIFSTKFIVECGNSKEKKYFKKEWQNNTSDSSEPIIESSYEGQDFTQITFFPDLKRFHLESLSGDMINLFKKRVHDIAGLLGSSVTVYLNNENITKKDFKDYINLYIPEISEDFNYYDEEMTSENWEIFITFSDGKPQQVSFVNGICTSRGGTHIEYIEDKIVSEVQKSMIKKYRTNPPPHLIKQYLWIFVKSSIENPTFDSPSKQKLTKKFSIFSKDSSNLPIISPKFIDQILNSPVIETIYHQVKLEQPISLIKNLKNPIKKPQKILGIPQLQDANLASSRKSSKCTLILAEVDYSKAFAMQGLEVIGRDYYGIYSLKGKLLNVKGATQRQLLQNTEIQNLVKILGLKPANHNYTTLQDLRYGSVLLLTDQDNDGTHKKGLILNFFHTLYPSLYKYKGFLKQFVFPQFICTSSQNTKEFFNFKDYQTWKSSVTHQESYKIQHFKGLGTFTKKQSIHFFKNIDKYTINFQYQDENDNKVMDLAFDRNETEERKNWIQNYNPDSENSFQITQEKTIRYSDFINNNLIHFPHQDNLRAIPSITDGLKPSQRKILFSTLETQRKNKENNPISVQKLSSQIQKLTKYPYGEIMLQNYIIQMAQNFTGSNNNINLFQPLGQFGTRYTLGRDYAQSSQIFTYLNPITKKIFIEEDNHILDYIIDGIDQLEPDFYLPIIPMCLINGAQGIGMGFSTFIPCFNPIEIAKNFLNKLENKPFSPILPYFKGFIGEISPIQRNIFDIKGIIKEKEEQEDILEILELPIGVSIQQFKQELEKLILSQQEQEKELYSFNEYHAFDKVHFELIVNPSKKHQLKGKLKKKLEQQINLSNMVMFNSKKKIVKYATVEEILEEFYEFRLEFYKKRKEYQISKLQRDIEIEENKIQFIKLLAEQKLVLNTSYEQIEKQLQNLQITPYSKINQDISSKTSNQKSTNQSDFNYLLSLPFEEITPNNVPSLQENQNILNTQLDGLKLLSPEEMWKKDLFDFLESYQNLLQTEEYEKQYLKKSQKH